MGLDWISDTLLPRLLAAGLQSLLVVAAIWLLCRYLRLSAAMRCWLWWFASLQLLVGALWPSPLSLPLLPSSWQQAAVAMNTAPAAPQLSAATQMPFFVTRSDLAASSSVADAAAPAIVADWLSWPLAFAALWLSGVLLVAFFSLRGYLEARRRIAESLPCEKPPVLQAYRSLGDSLGLKRLPPLRESGEIDSPQLIGPWPDAVLLPHYRLPQLNGEELAMALHHELVHVRRRDLWWGWVPALVQHLFFFHPLAHVIAREYSIAREAACDAAVLESRRYAAHDYGRLLLRLGVAPRPAAGVASASPTYVVLKRRLLMLQNATSSSHLGGLVLTAAVVLFGLVPYRVTAAAGEQTPHKQSSSVTIHSSSERAGETRITELRNGGKPDTWVVKGGEYYRVADDGRYEAVRDSATRARLQQRMSDAKQAEIEGERASREAEKASRQAEQAGREAEQAGREAERAGREAERNAATASRDAQRAAREAQQHASVAARQAQQAGQQARAQGLRDAAQARLNGEQARRNAEQGRRDAEQGRRDAEQARREAAQARSEALREADEARREAQREAEQARSEAMREAQREAQQARIEGQRDAEQARREALREAENARREGQQARAEAQREAQRARVEAQREAQQAREEAQRDAQQAQLEAQREAEQGRREAQRARVAAQLEREQALREAEQDRRDAERDAAEDAVRDTGRLARDPVQMNGIVAQIRNGAARKTADSAQIRQDALRDSRQAQAYVDVEKIRRDALQTSREARQSVDIEKIRRDALRSAREAVAKSQRDRREASLSQ